MGATVGTHNSKDTCIRICTVIELTAVLTQTGTKIGRAAWKSGSIFVHGEEDV